jgi:hypothetical protein
MHTITRNVATIERYALTLVVIALLCGVCKGNDAAADATPVTLAEAEIEIYLLPVGEAERQKGLDIAMEAQTSAQLNQADYHYFWVYNVKRKQSDGSVTIGYYAVNKHTAEVWDTDEKKQISSKLVLGIQRILRESHHIDEAAMEKYRSRPF